MAEIPAPDETPEKPVPIKDKDALLSFAVPFPEGKSIIIANKTEEFTISNLDDECPTLSQWIKTNYPDAKRLRLAFNISNTTDPRKLEWNIKECCAAIGPLLASGRKMYVSVGFQGRWSEFSPKEGRMLEFVIGEIESFLEGETAFFGRGGPWIQKEAIRIADEA